MNNPILNGLSNQMPMMQNVKQLKNLMQAAKNPQALLSQMMQNNPQYSQIINYINQNGGNPEKAFYKMAKEKGIDPDSFLKELKSNWN